MLRICRSIGPQSTCYFYEHEHKRFYIYVGVFEATREATCSTARPWQPSVHSIKRLVSVYKVQKDGGESQYITALFPNSLTQSLGLGRKLIQLDFFLASIIMTRIFKTHVKVPLWSWNDSQKIHKKHGRILDEGGGNFLAGQNIYPCVLFILSDRIPYHVGHEHLCKF